MRAATVAAARKNCIANNARNLVETKDFREAISRSGLAFILWISSVGQPPSFGVSPTVGFADEDERESRHVDQLAEFDPL